MSISLVFNIFVILSITTSFMVIFSKNPVYSILYLILVFCNIVVLLLILGLEFIPVTFIVVYVGAIVVLFLFVLMMLNIKLAETQKDGMNTSIIYLLIVVVLFTEFIWLVFLQISPIVGASSFNLNLLLDKLELVSFIFDFCKWLNCLTNVKAIGSLIFSYYFYDFLIAGYILLLAMIGAIVLSLDKKFNAYSQDIYEQVLRNHNQAIKKYI